MALSCRQAQMPWIARTIYRHMKRGANSPRLRSNALLADRPFMRPQWRKYEPVPGCPQSMGFSFPHPSIARAPQPPWVPEHRFNKSLTVDVIAGHIGVRLTAQKRSDLHQLLVPQSRGCNAMTIPELTQLSTVPNVAWASRPSNTRINSRRCCSRTASGPFDISNNCRAC